MSTRIMIGGDLAPTKTNINMFKSGVIEEIVDPELLNILSSANYRMFNLEAPLTDKTTPLKKCGPNFSAPSECINGIQALGVDFVTLANNHIMDQGEQGLRSTVGLLNKVKIEFAGAGYNLEEAAKTPILRIGGKKIGVYCCAEHEFSIAKDSTPGANPFDALYSLDHISNLKRQCDYVICLYHGGREHYRYPSPYLQKVCHKIIEKGADLVICQHSHCIGCEEKWQDGTIVYGQGNFLFDNSSSEFWKTSLLVCVDVEMNQISYVPIVKNANGVKLANKDEKENILELFNERTESIQKEGFIKKEYKKLADSYCYKYLTNTDMLCTSLVFRILNKASRNHLRKFATERKIRRFRERLINQYECEAHRELILYGLEDEDE